MREEVLELATQAGILPWTKHEWTGKELIHTDDGMDGDLACLIQFYELAVKRERERAVMICYACRDWENASEEIARRIMSNG